MKKILFLVSLFIALPSLSFADETAEKTKKFIDSLGNHIITIAGDSKINDLKKREKIIAEIDKVIDADWIARFVLGKNYKEASDAQRQRFISLYRSFMINTYGPKFKNYDGKKFTVLAVDKLSGFYVARCEFLPHTSLTPIKVDFRVKERNGQLYVLDFVAEGVSLIDTQRSEFNSAISQNGMDQFLSDFSARVKNLKDQNSK